MPYDINSDRRLRNTWDTIQQAIRELQRYRHIKIQNIMKENKVSLYEARDILDNKIKHLEQQRREEMKRVQKDIDEENKLKKQEEDERIMQEKEKLSLRREELHQAKIEKAKKEKETPPRVRRSARIQRKTSDDPNAKWRCGSLYTNNN
jgi:hypothetical protein|uniref:Uncharacterized protein n=1 Tax=viral metagenome TaxID=1070528 RepID=A0A6C0ILX2_9ZZZZ